MSKELNELITELGKIVDGNQSIVEEMDKLKSLYEKLKVEAEEEFEYPFEEYEPYCAVKDNGYVQWFKWDNECYDKPRYEQGHIFKTQQEAERERDKRALLTRFRQFRDKCNGDWKPDWKDKVKAKYFIVFNHESSELLLKWYIDVQPFESFGCFKNREDAIRAIELFGDEIKRLYVEE